MISHRGVAEVVGDGGSVLLRAGMLSEAYPGSYPSTPEPFNTFMADNFDGWVDEREAAYRVNDRYPDDSGYSAEVYEELPREVRPYYGELSRHGRWDYTADYGYVWYPSGMATVLASLLRRVLGVRTPRLLLGLLRTLGLGPVPLRSLGLGRRVRLGLGAGAGLRRSLGRLVLGLGRTSDGPR